ncbi:MAG: TonB-dependent receptor, partial [Steroidobacteraceae bacterium]
ASTLGGIIKIVSKKPDLTAFSGDVSISGVTVDDGASGYSTRGSVNVPLIQGLLAARVSLYDREDPGYVDNVLTGQSNINLDHAYGGRLSLRYQPMDKLIFDLTGLIQKLNAAGGTTEWLDPNTLRPIYGYAKYSTLGNTTASMQLSLFSLSANYDTGWGTLTNSLGSAHSFNDLEHLATTAELGPVLLPLFHLTSPPIAVEGNNTIPESTKTTDELRFTSIRMNHFLGQAGLYYTHETVGFGTNLGLIQYPGATPLPAPFNPILNAVQDGTYREYAGFGDLTYYITDDLDATAGIRYSHNEQTSTNGESGILANSALQTFRFSASDESYLFDLRYRVSPQLSTYLRAASAYRPGGPQTISLPGLPTSFGPDTDWNYEVGAKGLWLDGRLNANLAVYYIDWRNIQLTTTYKDIAQITGNSGDAKSEGVEFSGSYEPVRGLVFGANAAFDEAVMTAANPANTAGARVGDPLPYVPKWSGALTGDYSFPLAPDVKGGLGASWTYTDWRYSAFSENTTNPRTVLPSYPLLGLRGHVDWNQYNLALNVDNVANKQTFTNITYQQSFPGQTVPGLAYPLQPRTVRLTLSMKF